MNTYTVTPVRVADAPSEPDTDTEDTEATDEDEEADDEEA